MSTAAMLDYCGTHALEFRDGSTRRLVFDSPSVREWLAAEASRPTHNPRQAFLEAFSGQPGADVAPGAYAREIEDTRIVCTADSAVFIRVRVTTGSLKGSEGWVCWPVDVSPTLAMP
jgi:hypothetical protein